MLKTEKRKLKQDEKNTQAKPNLMLLWHLNVTSVSFKFFIINKNVLMIAFNIMRFNDSLFITPVRNIKSLFSVFLKSNLETNTIEKSRNHIQWVFMLLKMQMLGVIILTPHYYYKTSMTFYCRARGPDKRRCVPSSGRLFILHSGSTCSLSLVWSIKLW